MIPYEAAWGSSSSKKLKIKMNPAVYLAALLIEEGYAEPARHGYIQFLSKSGKAKGGRIDDGTSRHSQENVKAKAARKKRRPKTPCTIPGPVEASSIFARSSLATNIGSVSRYGFAYLCLVSPQAV